MPSKAKGWYDKHPNVIFVAENEGLGKDSVIISLHRSHSSYADFMRQFTVDWANFATDLQSFLVSVKNGDQMKTFDLSIFLRTNQFWANRKRWACALRPPASSNCMVRTRFSMFGLL
jgi:hypothetical protein